MPKVRSRARRGASLAPWGASRRRPQPRVNRPEAENEAELLPGFDLDAFLEAAHPDVEDALGALDVERRARSDGRQNHPPYDALEFSASEDRVVDHAEGGLKAVAADGVGALRRLRREVDDGLSTLQPPDFESHERDVALGLDDRYSRIRYDLRDLFKRRMIAERNLNYFRRSLGVARPARYPESNIYHFGLLAFVIVLESIANAYFFAQASDLGLLGGILQAAVFSLVNVAWSFGLGLTAYRYLNAPGIGFRLLAVIGVAVHLAGALLINLAIAHYRDLIALSPDGATFAVITQLKEAPFQLEAFESLMLFLIGSLIAGFAVWKGYNTDDPLPGYGPADRAFSEVDAVCRETREQLLLEAEDALDAARDPIDDDLAAFEASVGAVKDRLELFGAIADGLKNAGGAYQRLSTSLLKVYREENQAVRNDPAPAHFDLFPRLEVDAEIPDLDDIASRIRILEDLIEEGREEASKSRTRLQALHEQNRSALDGLFHEEEAAGGRIAEESFPAAFGRDQAEGAHMGRDPEPTLLEAPLQAQRRRAALERAAATAALMEDDESDGLWAGSEGVGSRAARAPSRQGGNLSRQAGDLSRKGSEPIHLSNVRQKPPRRRGGAA